MCRFTVKHMQQIPTHSIPLTKQRAIFKEEKFLSCMTAGSEGTRACFLDRLRANLQDRNSQLGLLPLLSRFHVILYQPCAICDDNLGAVRMDVFPRCRAPNASRWIHSSGYVASFCQTNTLLPVMHLRPSAVRMAVPASGRWSLRLAPFVWVSLVPIGRPSTYTSSTLVVCQNASTPSLSSSDSSSTSTSLSS